MTDVGSSDARDDVTVEAAAWSAPLPAEATTPTRIDRYTIVDEIGRGAYGGVYAAYDPKLDRRVALKVLAARTVEDQLGNDASRLLREARSMANVTHPNVAAVFDAGTFEGSLYMAMEFVQGQTLRRWLRQQTRPAAEIVEVMRQAGNGLAAAHRAGFVHRDFKPDNVLVGDDGRVRVVDFGLARPVAGLVSSTRSGDEELDRLGASAEASQSVVTNGTFLFAGTPAYMAPEQHRTPDVTPAGDQYAFCITLWEALYGERPFSGRNPRSLLTAKLAGVPASPRADGIPRAVRATLQRGLQVHPEDRHPDMDALLRGLDGGRRRKSGWIVASLLGCGLAGTAVGGMLDRPSTCRQTDTLGEAWSAQRASALRAAFDATGAKESADAAGRSIDGIEAFTDRWRNSQREACESHERLELSDEAYDLSMACLSRRRAELSALVDVLLDADAEVVSMATEAVSNVADPRECLDVEALRFGIEARGENDSGAVAEIRRDLLAANALQAAGRFEEARDTLVSLARALPSDADRRLRIDLQLALADAQSGAGDPESGLQAASAGWHEALRAGNDLAAAKAAITVAKIQGPELIELEQAEARIEDATAFIERLRDKSYPRAEELQAAVWTVQGGIANRRNDAATAIEYFGKVWKTHARLYGGHHPRTLQALSRLCVASIVLRAPEASIAYGEAALAGLEAALGPNHPTVAGIHNNLGLSYKHLLDFDSSLEHFHAALRANEAFFSPEHPGRLMVLRNLVNAYTAAKRYEDAARYADEYLEIVRGSHSRDHVPMVRRRAFLQDKLGDHLGALETLGHLAASLRPHVEQRHDRVELMDALLYESRIELDLDRAAEAYDSSDEALTLARSDERQDREKIGTALFRRAQAMWEAFPDRRGEALIDAREARELFMSRHPVPVTGVAVVNAWLAERER